MKKQLLLLFVGLVTLLFSIQSCKSTKATTKTNVNAEETVVIESGPNSYLNRFVSVDAILDLKPGMSYDEVYAKLGSKPHNLFSGQLDGHHIFQYKYRLTKIEVPSANTNNYGLEKKNNKARILFLTFIQIVLYKIKLYAKYKPIKKIMIGPCLQTLPK